MVPLVTSSSVCRERKEGGGQEKGKENKRIDERRNKMEMKN